MKLTADNIEAILPEHKSISYRIEQVTESIRAYVKTGDIALLEELKDICIKEQMTIEMANMYRNIGMYHFYSNNLSDGIISMHLAVDILSREDCISKLIECYSELGLLYFYNHDYLYAKRYFQETEDLIANISEINKHVEYLVYYRYGILLSNMQEYELALAKLEKALLYAEDEGDSGLVVMSIGLLYKRKKNMKAALRYYNKALCLFNDQNIKYKSMIYNNIAEIYKILGQYDKAVKYVNKAINCITDNDINFLFVYFYTLTEIKLLMGEQEAVPNEFFALLAKVKDFHFHKGLIIEGISSMIVIGSESGKILNRLETAIVGIVEDNRCENSEYCKELTKCLKNIRQYRKELQLDLKSGE